MQPTKPVFAGLGGSERRVIKSTVQVTAMATAPVNQKQESATVIWDTSTGRIVVAKPLMIARQRSVLVRRVSGLARINVFALPIAPSVQLAKPAVMHHVPQFLSCTQMVINA